MNVNFVWNEEESSSSGARVRPQQLKVDEVMGGVGIRVREEHGVSIVSVSKVVRCKVFINHTWKQGVAVVVKNNIHTLAARNPTINVITFIF